MTGQDAVRVQLATAVTHIVALLWVIDHHWLSFRLSAEEREAVDAARAFLEPRGDEPNTP